MKSIITSQEKQFPDGAAITLPAADGGTTTMKYHPTARGLGFLLLVVVVVVALAVFSPLSQAQTATEETKGMDSGNYNIQQSIEAGYRTTDINGNIATYDTFINLGSGIRLFDYTLDMRSLNHNGFLFDNLSFSNFGYGGDPNDVTRLRIEKNKIYDSRQSAKPLYFDA
jgi:hypothetical protein